MMAMSLERHVEKFDKRVHRAAKSRLDKKAAESAWRKVSEQVAIRDKHTCRVCTCQTTKWGKGNPRTWGTAHHIVYRSAGGSNDLSNLVWLCFVCHDGEHRHQIVITGTADMLNVDVLRTVTR